MDTQPVQPARKTNRKAIISLVLGVIGIFITTYNLSILLTPWPTGANDSAIMIFGFLCASGFAGLVLGVASLVTGILALWQIKKQGEGRKGKAIATRASYSVHSIAFRAFILSFIWCSMP
jgi:hypothetical protein